jgi:hypothetical protein
MFFVLGPLTQETLFTTKTQSFSVCKKHIRILIHSTFVVLQLTIIITLTVIEPVVVQSFLDRTVLVVTLFSLK